MYMSRTYHETPGLRAQWTHTHTHTHTHTMGIKSLYDHTPARLDEVVIKGEK